jgi:hypothetical protein
MWLRRILKFIWRTAQALAFLFITVLQWKPDALQLIGIGATMTAWLLQPHVLAPLVAVVTLMCADWLLQWRWRRKQSALQRLAITYDLPVRKAYKYLRFESQWATTMPDANEGVMQARDILEDAFSAGALSVWGREFGRDTPSLRPIVDNSFWAGTILNAFSLSDFYEAPNADSNRGTYFDRRDQRFKDLHVSRRQVEERWPRANWLQRWRLRMTMGQPNWDADARARGERKDRLRQWRRNKADWLRVQYDRVKTWSRHTYSTAMGRWRR